MSRDPAGEIANAHLYVYLLNAPVDDVDPFGLVGNSRSKTLDIPATPEKCKKVNRALDNLAFGHNQNFLDHWREGSGLPMEVGFGKFDFGSSVRSETFQEALTAAATLGVAAQCNETVTGSHNQPMPDRSNQHSYYYSPMIYGWRFWYECAIEATKECADNSENCCVGINVTADCTFHASDHINFWPNDSSTASVPPYTIYDRLVRACNPKGQGFDVTARHTRTKSETATCEGRLWNNWDYYGESPGL